MKRLILVLAALALIILPACSSMPSDTGGGSLLAQQSPADMLFAFFSKDLRSADSNAQSYIKIGKLKPNDPVAGCIRDAMVEFGLDSTDTPGGFEPKRDGAISEFVIIYAQKQALDDLLGNVQGGTVNCDAVVGRMFKGGMRALRMAAPLAARVALPVPLPIPLR